MGMLGAMSLGGAAAGGSTSPKAGGAASPYPYVFSKKDVRLRAAKAQGVDFSQTDPIMHYMLSNAETNFPPKRVHGPSDWLKTQKESGQDLAKYKRGGPNISWYDKRRAGTIFLFVIDDSI